MLFDHFGGDEDVEVVTLISSEVTAVLGNSVRINVPTTANTARVISKNKPILTALLLGYEKEIISGINLSSIGNQLAFWVINHNLALFLLKF